MSRTQGMALGLLVTAVLVGAGLGAMGGQTGSTGSTATTEVGRTVETFPVYVSGWVSTPGVVQVPKAPLSPMRCRRQAEQSKERSSTR